MGGRGDCRPCRQSSAGVVLNSYSVSPFLVLVWMMRMMIAIVITVTGEENV